MSCVIKEKFGFVENTKTFKIFTNELKLSNSKYILVVEDFKFDRINFYSYELHISLIIEPTLYTTLYNFIVRISTVNRNPTLFTVVFKMIMKDHIISKLTQIFNDINIAKEYFNSFKETYEKITNIPHEIKCESFFKCREKAIEIAKEVVKNLEQILQIAELVESIN